MGDMLFLKFSLNVTILFTGIYGLTDTPSQFQSRNRVLSISGGHTPIHHFLSQIPKGIPKRDLQPKTVEKRGGQEDLIAQDYVAKGLQQEQRGNFTAAIAAYDKAIQLDPKLVTAYFSRGLVYFNLRDREKALADLTKAIQLDPTRPQTYHHRGLVYVRLNQKRNAKADFRKAIELYQQKGDDGSARRSQAELEKLEW
jgi:tetratricopeptide (TPR) repeat protein